MKAPIAPERVMNEGAARVLQWLDQHPEHDLRQPITGRLVAQIAAELAMLESSVWRRLEELRNLPKPKVRAAVPEALLPTLNGHHPTPDAPTPTPHEENTHEMSTETLEKPAGLSERQTQVWEAFERRGWPIDVKIGWKQAEEIGKEIRAYANSVTDMQARICQKLGRPLQKAPSSTPASEEPAPVEVEQPSDLAAQPSELESEGNGPEPAPADPEPSSTPEPLVIDDDDRAVGDPFTNAELRALQQEIEAVHKLLDENCVAPTAAGQKRLEYRVRVLLSHWTQDCRKLEDTRTQLKDAEADAAKCREFVIAEKDALREERACRAEVEEHNAALQAEVEQLRSQAASLQAAQTSSTPVPVRHEDACADIVVTHEQPLSAEERRAAVEALHWLELPLETAPRVFRKAAELAEVVVR